MPADYPPKVRRVVKRPGTRIRLYWKNDGGGAKRTGGAKLDSYVLSQELLPRNDVAG